MLISMKANIEDKGVKGDCTPLMEAANAGYVDIVQLLIANGADVNAKSTAGQTRSQFRTSIHCLSIWLGINPFTTDRVKALHFAVLV